MMDSESRIFTTVISLEIRLPTLFYLIASSKRSEISSSDLFLSRALCQRLSKYIFMFLKGLLANKGPNLYANKHAAYNPQSAIGI